MALYRYTECGLDNVLIDGMMPCEDDDGDEVVVIPNIRGLHRAIAAGIVEHLSGMSGQELRFLRTEIGMTQAELAQVVHRDAQSIGRWERGEVNIDSTAEALVRLLAIEELKIDVGDERIAELSKRCVPTDNIQQILIDGSDPNDYKPIAA